MKSLLKLIVIVLFLSGCGQSEKADDRLSLSVTTLPTLIKDQVAAGLIKAEKLEEALNVYLSTLELDPFEATTHSNIAVLLSRTEKSDEALKSFEHALKIAETKKDFKSLFAIHYNLGVFFGEKNKIVEALEHYQAALDIVPTSKETKTNIELLIQQQQQQQQNGQGDNKDKKDNQDQKDDKKDQKNDKNGKGDQDKKDDQSDGKDKKDNQDNKDDKKDQNNENNKKAQSSPKYKPRPFQGDQLSEGDVKKILGELKNQEQKIRANFDKKERKDSKNEKDW